MKVNIDRLLDIVIEYFDSEDDYHRSSKKYREEHGHGVFFDSGRQLTKEEKHIEYAYHNNTAMYDVVSYICDVLNLDSSRKENLYKAGRAARKWYVKTNWETCIPFAMLDQFEQYIFGV